MKRPSKEELEAATTIIASDWWAHRKCISVLAQELLWLREQIASERVKLREIFANEEPTPPGKDDNGAGEPKEFHLWVACPHGQQETRSCQECTQADLNVAEARGEVAGYRRGLEAAFDAVKGLHFGSGARIQRLLDEAEGAE